MRYISPFEALGIEIDGNLNKENLNLAKKRLLAELDLSDAPTILRGSVEMTKNDIITQFDKLAAVKNWDFHRLIAADKALLGFIENRDWKGQKHLLKEPKYNDAAFIDFVSPYFAESYKLLIIKHLSNRSIKNLAAVLEITPRLLTENDHDDAWFSVESFLDGWKDNLNDIAENVRNGQQYGDKELIPYQAKQFIQCLNLLPDDFMWFRDDYATSLFNLSAYSWNKEQHYRAIDIVKNARLLNISDETAAMLDARIAWFEEQIGRANASNSSDSSDSSDSSKRWSGATTFRVLLFVIFVFVRLATCEYSSSKSNSNVAEMSPSEYAESSELVQKAMKETLVKTTKQWDKTRFTTEIDKIKKSDNTSVTKAFNNMIIDKALLELRELKTMATVYEDTEIIEEINNLMEEFKRLKKTKGLK